jgi:flagellar hook-basal body complex protein FliE
MEQMKRTSIGRQVKTGGIDSSRIEAMIAQLKSAATRPEAKSPRSRPRPRRPGELRRCLQGRAGLRQRLANGIVAWASFTMGDDKVSLSDVMVSMQKSSIEFQATVQVRNKLACIEIMNMRSRRTKATAAIAACDAHVLQYAASRPQIMPLLRFGGTFRLQFFLAQAGHAGIALAFETGDVALHGASMLRGKSTNWQPRRRFSLLLSKRQVQRVADLQSRRDDADVGKSMRQPG